MRTAFFVALLTVANLATAAGKLMFPVPKNAEQVGHVVIQPAMSEQDHFVVNAEFPSTAALEHYDKVFAKWTSCKAPEPGWLSYGDLSTGAGRFIHNRMQFWVSKDNKFAVVAFIRYESKGVEYRARPDNNRQFVGVVRHKVKDALGFLSELKAECPATPNIAVNADAPKVARPSP